jgi:heme/copper-type cytochrome/quinol oxidase subunit 2
VRERLFAWFGVFGAPFAWVVQFLVGYGLTIAACNPPGSTRSVSVNGITIAATIVAGVVALLAGAAATLAFIATREREEDDPPPAGRVHFLAVIGMTITPLFFFIIVLSGLGVVSVPGCRQG